MSVGMICFHSGGKLAVRVERKYLESGKAYCVLGLVDDHAQGLTVFTGDNGGDDGRRELECLAQTILSFLEECRVMEEEQYSADRWPVEDDREHHVMSLVETLP